MKKNLFVLAVALFAAASFGASRAQAQTSTDATGGFDLDRIVPHISFCFDLAGAPEARFGFSFARRPVFSFIERRGWGCNVVVKATSTPQSGSSTADQAILDAAGARFRSQIAETIKTWARAWFETILGRFIK